MGLELNEAKSACNVHDEQVPGECLEGVRGYKYLGILEHSKCAVQEENLSRVREKVMARVRLLCATKLNAIHLSRAINEFAISVYNYYIGLLKFEPGDFARIDTDIRNVFKEFGVIRQSSNVDRLYLSRSKLGRGFLSVEELAERVLLKLHDYLAQNTSTLPVLKNEKEKGSQLGIIRQFLANKYALSLDNVSVPTLFFSQEEHRMQRINEKVLHKQLFTNEDGFIDQERSSMWLIKGNMSPQQEGMWCKLQDRNVFFGTTTECPHCGKAIGVDHLATACGRLLAFDYTHRHNEIVRCLHLMFARRYVLTNARKMRGYKVQDTLANARARICSDKTILTHNRVECNKPDLLVHDLKENVITLVEVGVTNKSILKTVEVTKSRKYDHLANELRQIYGAKVVTVPIIISWDGLVTKFSRRYMEDLGVNKQIFAYIQTVVLRCTCQSILIDCRLRPAYDEELVVRAFDRLDTNNDHVH